MHRPSSMILEADLQIDGMINSYGQVYFKDFKYLSDSRRHWREPVEEIIASRKYEKLHILTHAFSYNDEDLNIHDLYYDFVNRANAERYILLKENVTELESVLTMDEVTR